ncbi:hypothetical protein [Gelidibacter sp. F63206]|uniref:DUF7793 family protein n=1 Tax=Gelidibacter sp. F63206 TaxID=2926425 RepID=UPI001FF0FE70|nr:hypothetical protein [Gelidibacter sp. F63206]MCK0115100.1 hypothetical protein [Gelidibacter sp. F63206]
MLAENDYATYEIIDGVVHVIYKNVDLDISKSVRIVKDRLQLQAGRFMPVLCDIRAIQGIDKAARAYLSLEGSAFVNAVAFVVDSPISEMLSDIYLTTNSPIIPTKSFLNREEAIEFLNRFR